MLRKKERERNSKSSDIFDALKLDKKKAMQGEERVAAYRDWDWEWDEKRARKKLKEFGYF